MLFLINKTIFILETINHVYPMKRIVFFALLSVIMFNYVIAQDVSDSTKTVKKHRAAIIPMINYNNTIGTIFGTIGQMFYKINPQDTISPTSSTGILGIYTTNNSYMVAVYQQLYLDEDNWRIIAALGLGNFNFQCWVGGAGRFVNYGTGANFALLRVEKKVYKELYFGVEGMLNKSELGFDLPDWIPEQYRSTKSNLNYLGYLIDYDKREHQMTPYEGYNIAFKNTYYREWMNSTADFQVFDFTYNHFFQIKNERNILATRVKAVIATGDVPFQGQTVVGSGDDLRGYSNGKFRNDELYAIQAEYRWRFYKKFGMVGFAGVASSVKNFDDIFSTEVLPAAGVGIRYMMIAKERINIGIDVAKGKDDWGLTFRIGESFGR